MPIVLESAVPHRKRSRGLLLEAISTFDVPSDVTQGNSLRWLEGVRFQPHPCTGPNLLSLAPCDTAQTFGSGTGCEPYVLQYPFQIEDALNGSPLQLDDDDLDELLDERAEITLSYAFGRALLGPLQTTSQLTLSTSAHAPDGLAFGAASTPLTNAIAALESELADNLFGGVGMIHVPPAMMHQLMYRGALIPTDAHWETPNGHIVVSDAGYHAPPAPTGGGASALGEDWIYSSGLVVYQHTDRGINTDGTVDIVHSRIERIRNQMGILLFDPCPVSAVLTKYEQS